MLKIILFSAFFSTFCTLRGVHKALWVIWPVAFMLSPAWHVGTVIGTLKFNYIGATALIAVVGIFLTGSNQAPGSVPRKTSGFDRSGDISNTDRYFHLDQE